MTRDNKDIRSVSDKMIEELTTGKFKPFVDFVREMQANDIDDNLALCFRGSGKKDEVVSIYKYNTKVWDLSFAEGKPRVTIDFNYARFYEKWMENVHRLSELGFKIGRASNNDNVSGQEEFEPIIKAKGDIKKLVFDIGSVSEVEKVIRESYKIISDMLDDYYCHGDGDMNEGEKRRNYFKEYYHSKTNNGEKIVIYGRKQYRLEKHTQQEIFMKNHNLKDGLFIYDLEFHQPTKEGVDEELNKNEPDMFGIYFDEKRMPVSICMIEIKSTQSALCQESGLKRHREGMEKYLKCEELMQDRIEEAVFLLSDYAKLKLYGVTEEIARSLENNRNNLKKRIVFVFTNELTKHTKFKDIDGRYTIDAVMEGYDDCTEKIIYGDWCRKDSKGPFSYIK